MTLLVDLGNSRIKWASSNGKNIKYPGGCSHYGKKLSSVLDRAWGKKKKPAKVFVANVAGDAYAEALTQWTEHKWHITPEYLSATGEHSGVVNHYVEPHRLGIDRWVAVIAAHRKFTLDACIVDCGTATTIDAVTKEGQHLGGLIVPGLTLMRNSLLESTDALSKIEKDAAEVSFLAKDTEGAILGGTLYAAIATIDRIMIDVRAKLDANAVFIITGGGSESLLPLLQQKFQFERDLVLHGLNILIGDKE